MVSAFVVFLIVASLPNPVPALSNLTDSGHQKQILVNNSSQTFHPREHLQRLRTIKAYLKQIKKPAVKTIQATPHPTHNGLFLRLVPILLISG